MDIGCRPLVIFTTEQKRFRRSITNLRFLPHFCYLKNQIITITSFFTHIAKLVFDTVGFFDFFSKAEGSLLLVEEETFGSTKTVLQMTCFAI